MRAGTYMSQERRASISAADRILTVMMFLQRWAGDHATESSGRLALPAQEGQAREQSGTPGVNLLQQLCEAFLFAYIPGI